jgi:hypothetical protein
MTPNEASKHDAIRRFPQPGTDRRQGSGAEKMLDHSSVCGHACAQIDATNMGWFAGAVVVR